MTIAPPRLLEIAKKASEISRPKGLGEWAQ